MNTKTEARGCASLPQASGSGGEGEVSARSTSGESGVGSAAAIDVDECQQLVGGGGRNPEIVRTGIHEGGHICASRFLNLEVAGSTLIEGPSYTGLTWGPGSKRALRGKAAYDRDKNAAP